MAPISTTLPPVDDGFTWDDLVAEQYARVVTAIIDDHRHLCLNLAARLRLTEAMLEGVDERLRREADAPVRRINDLGASG